MSGGWRLLLFGASGAIGGAIAKRALARGWSVTGVTRGSRLDDDDGILWRGWDPLTDREGGVLDGDPPFDGVCWAQGTNLADSVVSFDAERHLDVYRANVLTVLQSISTLTAKGKLREEGARLTVISSIWQERARADKLSYCISKAAVGGLVRSASVDLGRDGHLVNGVLPGVLDTPMAHANLSPTQIGDVTARTPAGRLPDLDTLAETVLFLCSAENNAISGQSVTVDLGMSNAILL